MVQKQAVFGVFYHDYVNEVAVNSTKPQSVLAARIPQLARRLLIAQDNYLGVVDRNDVILQLYLDAGGDVIVPFEGDRCGGRGSHRARPPEDASGKKGSTRPPPKRSRPE